MIPHLVVLEHKKDEVLLCRRERYPFLHAQNFLYIDVVPAKLATSPRLVENSDILQWKLLGARPQSNTLSING